tara:strand:+ start:1278 stop:2999 length:1722 start_codon:yes stop_codon:yes gene_type:complete
MEKINKLKNKLKNFNLDGYIIPKNDEFFSEYVSCNKDLLQHISNFSGSYGLALILKSDNFLFVDGRYTVQANNQSGKNFKIVTLPLKKIRNNLNIKNKKIGFDPKLFNERSIKQFEKKLSAKFIAMNNSLINLKEKNKNIKLKNNKFYVLDKSITGETSQKKIKKLKKYFYNNNIDVMLVTSSENVAWLLNIRGNDSDFSPIPNSFLLIDKQMRIFLFCNLKKVDDKFKKKLDFVNIFEIKDLEDFLLNIKNKNFSIDQLTCSIFYSNIIKKNNYILKDTDPIYFLKSQKNNVEINNIKKIHKYDGAALTKFIFWIKSNFKKRKITEISAQKKLLKFRKKFKDFKTLSFPTISSTGSNGAIVHYNAIKKTNKVLKKGNIYLVDSGGQYHFGTTDVTRTISLDNNKKRIKNIFTKVLKGHLNLSNYKLTQNTTGNELDKLARKDLNLMNLDYAHGTGHGVGYYLNVHEGPQAISKNNKVKLKAGMILSNEPGYYEKGKFGLRIENLIFVRKDKNKNKFENLTYAPIDKNLIEKDLLNKKEVSWLNKYHKSVFNNLKKYMNKNELKFLKNSCSSI